VAPWALNKIFFTQKRRKMLLQTHFSRILSLCLDTLLPINMQMFYFPDFFDLIVLFVNPIDDIYKKLFRNMYPQNHLNNNEVDK